MYDSLLDNKWYIIVNSLWARATSALFLPRLDDNFQYRADIYVLRARDAAHAVSQRADLMCGFPFGVRTAFFYPHFHDCLDKHQPMKLNGQQLGIDSYQAPFQQVESLPLAYQLQVRIEEAVLLPCKAPPFTLCSNECIFASIRHISFLILRRKQSFLPHLKHLTECTMNTIKLNIDIKYLMK